MRISDGFAKVTVARNPIEFAPSQLNLRRPKAPATASYRRAASPRGTMATSETSLDRRNPERHQVVAAPPPCKKWMPRIAPPLVIRVRFHSHLVEPSKAICGARDHRVASITRTAPACRGRAWLRSGSRRKRAFACNFAAPSSSLASRSTRRGPAFVTSTIRPGCPSTTPTVLRARPWLARQVRGARVRLGGANSIALDFVGF